MKRLIGERPANWQILEAHEIPVRDFLSRIDFFVYFHHPDWVEAYGRTVAERPQRDESSSCRPI
jgi:hypothetical protein